MESLWQDFTSHYAYAYVVLPALIFLARMTDVSLATLRFVFISRGHRALAPLIGFFEVLVWLLAITQILTSLTNPLYYIAYASGFSAGTFVGLWIENRLAIGMVLIRIITRMDGTRLIHALKEKKYGLTFLNAEGATGQVQIIFTVVRRARAPDVIRIIQEFNPNAFYSLEDLRQVRDPLPPALEESGSAKLDWLRILKRR